MSIEKTILVGNEGTCPVCGCPYIESRGNYYYHFIEDHNGIKFYPESGLCIDINSKTDE
jgi:hypothetical protein